MPIYEYRCTRCGHELDALQKVADAPLTVCPKCNERALVKKISAAGFRLKGGGWYETDFKSGRKRNVAGESAAGGDGAGGSAGEGAAAGKSSGDGAGKSSGGGAGKASGGESGKKSSDSGSGASGSGAKGSSGASSDGG